MARPDSRWMPLDWADYWRDTGHLSAAEHGAYLNLLGAYWVAGGPLPVDENRLKRLAKMVDKEWKLSKPTVLAFFTVVDEKLHHKRVDRELARAATVYAKRKETMEKINAKRKRTPITIIVHDQRDGERTQSTSRPLSPPLPPHSPNGEVDANASTPKQPRKARRTRLEADWKPDAESERVAADEGLTADEITADLAEWREYWTGPEPVSPLKADWQRTYRNHVKQYAPGIIARRVRSGQPSGNGQRVRSITDAVNRAKAKAEGAGGFPESGGMRRDFGGLSSSENDPGHSPFSDDIGGEIIDAADGERLYWDAGTGEAFDGVSSGTTARSGSTTDPVREDDAGLPGGRDPARAEDAA